MDFKAKEISWTKKIHRSISIFLNNNWLFLPQQKYEFLTCANVSIEMRLFLNPVLDGLDVCITPRRILIELFSSNLLQNLITQNANLIHFYWISELKLNSIEVQTLLLISLHKFEFIEGFIFDSKWLSLIMTDLHVYSVTNNDNKTVLLGSWI